ncbi:LysR family transcriptional regulator [Thetidibacter halocola]|uniref:HTH-type transcriptional regulator CbbR n=1 Tax=Thetidibacter halocola TaxID=2827239 RepID=A0A8J8B9B8_9RHOB|nr:LysR family transcriptional regulator [Thetidibacter halocola]MBS0124023.1 LysR family transcriptional regulator [Thetidibacter halocola]
MKRLDQLNLRQLRALKTVAEERTVSAAANVLGLTPPAVHTQLKNLEEIIGAPLIERESKDHAVLTRHGRALVRAYDEMRATLERTIVQLNALDSGRAGSVTLGVVSTAKYFAPGIVAMLGQEMPDLAVRLIIGNRGEIVEGLERGAYDLCIMGRPPREPLVDAVRIGPHPHVIIAPPEHPLAARRGLAPSDLVDERFVLREDGSGTRLLTERFLAEIDEDRPVARIEMSSNETIKQAVLSGLGIALISAHTVAYELSVGRLVALDVAGLPILRSWYVTRSEHVARTQAADRVQDWLVKNAPRFLPELPF